MFRSAVVLFALFSSLAPAMDSDATRKEIEASYIRALDALKHAKSIEDLDEINRTFDTLDWQSIVPGQEPRGWPELRRYGFEGLRAPFKSAELIIETFEVTGDVGVLTGKLRYVNLQDNVALIPLKETWKKTVIGWKRQIHQKFRAGETPK